MARFGSDKVSFFLIDGLNVVGSLTEFTDSLEAKTEESHGLGDAWVENSYVGVKAAEIVQQGFYDDETGNIHDAFSSGPSVATRLAYCLEGTATGVNFVSWSSGLQINYQRQAERDGLTKARATYRNGVGVVEQGKLLHTYKAVGTTGLKNIVDRGSTAATDGGASAGSAIGILGWNGVGEANIRIMHSASAGMATAATLVTFTKITGGHGSERVIATGAIKRYVAAIFTTASATGSIGNLNAFVGLVVTA